MMMMMMMMMMMIIMMKDLFSVVTSDITIPNLFSEFCGFGKVA